MTDASPSHFTALTMDRLTTPLGVAVFLTERCGALWALDWADHEGRLVQRLRARATGAAEFREGKAPRAVRTALERYFEGDMHALDELSCATSGTPFQEAVWAELRAIPAGTTTTYGELAARIGRPRAARAVGLANNKNPIGVVVPCHRVVGANGSLTGYAGGLARKRWLLEHEARHAPQPWISSTARASSASSADSLSMRAMSAR